MGEPFFSVICEKRGMADQNEKRGRSVDQELIGINMDYLALSKGIRITCLLLHTAIE